MNDPLAGTPLGIIRGQQGMNTVLEHQSGDFAADLANVIRTYFRGMTVTGDVVTAKAKELGLMPTHPNAWGAAYRAIQTRYPGLLIPTGRWIPSVANPKNNGSRYPLYKVKA